jgi:hypothetical protein
MRIGLTCVWFRVILQSWTLFGDRLYARAAFEAVKFIQFGMREGRCHFLPSDGAEVVQMLLCLHRRVSLLVHFWFSRIRLPVALRQLRWLVLRDDVLQDDFRRLQFLQFFLLSKKSIARLVQSLKVPDTLDCWIFRLVSKFYHLRGYLNQICL